MLGACVIFMRHYRCSDSMARACQVSGGTDACSYQGFDKNPSTQQYPPELGEHRPAGGVLC